MSPERWRRIDELFDSAVRLDAAERPSWLERACGDDDGLRDEVGRLIALDERADRDGFLAPPAPPAPTDRTATWAAPGANGRAVAADDATTDGFTPKPAIADGGTTGDETRAAVRARLREVPVIFALIFGVMLFLRPFVLNKVDATVFVANGLVIAALLTIAAVLSSRRSIGLAGLRAIELGMIGMLAALVAFYQYRHILRLSLEADTGSAQLVMKNVVLLTTLLIFVFGIYVPKGWRRVAGVAGPLALLPLATLGLLYLLHPETMEWIGRDDRGRIPLALFGLDAVFLLTLAGVSAFGANTISRLRREVVEARQLGQYRLGRRLGAGGMGEVYLAEHRLLKRPCAIKLIRPGAAIDSRTLERFEREVRITATLSHWNTVEIFDYGRTEDGTYYYVMEYLPGLGLGELVDRHGPIPPGRAVYLLRQVCLALREAHAAGLIHRDVKPSNIFAARRGGMDDVAKLLDFGLVRPSATYRDAHLSSEGQILGTPLFMSPEQAMGGRELDARSDIYSLGAVAYYVLTGRPPFDETTGIGAMIAHARDPVVPPSKHRADVPADLERVILRCLAKDPADRYQDAETLEDALASCSSSRDWGQRAASRWWAETGRVLPVV